MKRERTEGSKPLLSPKDSEEKEEEEEEEKEEEEEEEETYSGG